jgi:hypothetical protein
MDRKTEQVELFRAYTAEELRLEEQNVVGGKSSYFRGEDSSSYSIKV